MLHLENRLIASENDIDRPDLFEPIDYDAVYEILDREKDRCRKWLTDALKKPKVKAFSDYDMMLRLKSDSERDELMKLIQEQNEKIEVLENLIMSFIGMDRDSLSSVIDIIEYLDRLKQEKSGKIIIISVKETTGFNLGADIASRLKDGFGLANYLEDKQDRPYIAVIDEGTAEYEQLGDKDTGISYSGNVSGHEITVISRSVFDGIGPCIHVIRHLPGRQTGICIDLAAFAGNCLCIVSGQNCFLGPVFIRALGGCPDQHPDIVCIFRIDGIFNENRILECNSLALDNEAGIIGRKYGKGHHCQHQADRQ